MSEDELSSRRKRGNAEPSSRRSPRQDTRKSRPSRQQRENSSKSNSASSLGSSTLDDIDDSKHKKDSSRRGDISKSLSSNRARADQDRKDRETKRQAKRDQHVRHSNRHDGIAIGVPGAESVGPSDKKSVAERRKTRGKDQEESDRSTKRAARSSKSPTRPGAVSSRRSESTDRASRKAARSSTSPSRPGAVSSHGADEALAKRKGRATVTRQSQQERIDSEAKKAARSSRRSTRPGATSSNQADRAKAKNASSGLAAFDEEKDIVVEGGSKNDDAGLEIQAELVEDDDDDTNERKKEKMEQAVNHRQQQMEDENERLRLEMEAMRLASAAKKKKTQRKIIVALVLLAIIGGCVGAYVATRGSNSEEAGVPDDKTPAAIEATDSPTGLILQSPSPSDVPTSSPTAFLKYPSPSLEDCDAVVQQLPVDGEGDMPVLGYAIEMDAILSRDVAPDTVLADIEEKLKSTLVPSLVGCTDLGRRQLRGKLQAHRQLVNSLQFAIANAKVTVNLSDDGVCETETTQTCYRITVTLQISLKGEEKILDIMGIVLQVFQQDDLVDFLSLNQPAEILLMMTIASTDITEQPSASPTGIPSIPPSMAPSSSPSTSSPSDAPSSDPTRAPATGPTTDEPTQAPVAGTPSPTVIPLTSSPTCPGVEAYFDNGLFDQQTGSQDGSYSIACSATSEIVALTYNSDTCAVQCEGSLGSASYSQSCTEDSEVSFVLPGDFQNDDVLIGYRSSFNTLTCGTSMIIITDAPTAMPFPGSTPLPTLVASDAPTLLPSSSPSSGPSSMPSNEPSSSPSTAPSTNAPTLSTPSPTARPDVGALLSEYVLDPDALDWLTNVDTWPLDESNPNLALELLERHDLYVFYQATGGSSWTTSTDWLSSTHVCAWEFVGCSNSRVTGIYLSQANLIGSLPTVLGRLANLQNLNLSGNNFGSSSPSLPSEIGQLTELTHIDINNSNLKGTIPENVLNQLVNLNYLNLKNNNLQGTFPEVPSSFGGCSVCFLQGNSFEKVGQVLYKGCFVDVCIRGNSECNNYCLPNERRAYIEDVLSGYDVNPDALNWLADVDTWYPNVYNPSVKREVLERHDLVRLYLSTGGDSWTTNTHWLNGAHICGWYYVDCTSYFVSSLFLSNNNLIGEIPTEIGRFTSLSALFLGGNDFSSSSQSLPTELGELTQLTRVKIFSSNLQGTIPDVLDRLSNLNYLNLQDNQLVGDIPTLPSGIQSQDCTNCALEQNDFVDIQNGIDQFCNITVCADGQCNNTCFQ